MNQPEAFAALEAAVDGAPIGTVLDWAGIPAGQVANIATARGWDRITNPVDLAILLRAFCRAQIAARVAAGEIAIDHAEATREIQELIADGLRLRALNHRSAGWLVVWDEGRIAQDPHMERIGEAMEILDGTPEALHHLRRAIDGLLADQAAAARQTRLEL
jgi:hypothetical protein